MSRARRLTWLVAALLAAGSARARAEAPADSTVLAVDGVTAPAAEPVAPASNHRPTLEALVPEVAAAPYRIEPGVRPFVHRLAFSPGFGQLGTERLFSFRLAYNPNAWMGYEGSVDHNPGQAVHAALHMLSVVVRRPLPGRIQPYASAGYGMMMVFPGKALNADPVTKNAVAVGGGIEFYVRGDLAVRGEMRRATVFGRQGDRDGVVAFDYLQQTIGLSFYRTLKP